ncbi:MAG: adenosylcobinamide-GDP ribazoletransferase [Pseudomonadota bacterium]
MPRHPTLIDARDVPAALGLLTRLPVSVDGAWAAERGAASAWAYPIAGIVLGILLSGISTALSLFLPPAMTAALVLSVSVVVTGALHEDGLADTCDGLWGGWTRERRLEIMKDSRIGAYGVIVIALSLLLRWLGLTLIIESGLWWALIAIPAASRAAMVPVMALRHAKQSGLSARVGRPRSATIYLALALGILALLPLGWPALTVALLIALAGSGAALIAWRKIGGQTGDILGATQQIAEIAAYIALSAHLT